MAAQKKNAAKIAKAGKGGGVELGLRFGRELSADHLKAFQEMVPEIVDKLKKADKMPVGKFAVFNRPPGS